MMKDIYLGIDFGNETCCISQAHDTQNISSYILFGAKNRKIGNNAQDLFLSSMENTVYNFKRFLGGTLMDSEIEKEECLVTYEVCNTFDGDIGVKVTYLKQERIFTITQIAAMLLAELRKAAENHFKGRVLKCVIAVPSYFTNVVRLALLDSAKIAGLSDVELINENAAAAFLYRLNNRTSFVSKHYFQKIIIVDMGHSSLQVSACCISRDRIDILATVTCLSAGGRDIDMILATHFVSELWEKKHFTGAISMKSYRKLLIECKKLKHNLSDNTSHAMPIVVENFVNNETLSSSLDKKALDVLCSDLRSKIEEVMHAVLHKSRLNPNDIHCIELVGGSTRVPFVKDIARRTFGKDPNWRLGHDVAVAKGCSLRCSAPSSDGYVPIYDRLLYPISICWPTTNKNYEGIKQHQLFFAMESFPIARMRLVPSSTKVCAHYCEVKEVPENEKLIGCYSSPVSSNKHVAMEFDINTSGIFSRKMAVKNKYTKNTGEVSCVYSHESALPEEKLQQFIKEQIYLELDDKAENARLEAKVNLETICYTWRNFITLGMGEPDCPEFQFLKEHVLLKINTVLENFCDRDGQYSDLPTEEYEELIISFQEKSDLLKDFFAMKYPSSIQTGLNKMKEYIMEILKELCPTNEEDTTCMKKFEVLFVVLKKYQDFMMKSKPRETESEMLSRMKVFVKDVNTSIQRKVEPSQQSMCKILCSEISFM